MSEIKNILSSVSAAEQQRIATKLIIVATNLSITNIPNLQNLNSPAFKLEELCEFLGVDHTKLSTPQLISIIYVQLLNRLNNSEAGVSRKEIEPLITEVGRYIEAHV